MPKGMITQGVSVLLEEEATLDAIEAALGDFEIKGRKEAGESWKFGGPSVVVPFRPECNGFVVIDTVGQPWPDHMGDPQDESILFGAWAMGQFGPFIYPGSLERAGLQSWAWEEGKTVADRHRAFIRIRSSYVFGAGEDAPVMPEDYEPVAELKFVSEIAAALLELPKALCYLNPNGEVLRGRDLMLESLRHESASEVPPMDLWSNVRLFNFDADWSVMDTVGNGQLDIPDVEACFEAERYDLGEVDLFLRNLSIHLLEHGEVFEDGDTTDGPGGVSWQVKSFENGLSDPPRRVLRWLARDESEIPVGILEEVEEAS